MTTWENTDSINESENLTVTSDAAFERVTNDFKMEDERDVGSLKQNTAWLVDEIPNISILDVSDFLIENKKTLYDRQNWNVVIGKAGRSIEAQPQDIWIYKDVVHELNVWLWEAKFSTYVWWSNNTCFDPNSTLPWLWAFIIKEKWIYRVSYSFTMSDISSSATLIMWFIMRLESWWTLHTINEQFYWNGIWWQPIWISYYSASWDTHIEFNEWDRILLGFKVTDTNWDWVWRGLTQAEFTTQFIQYKL